METLPSRFVVLSVEALLPRLVLCVEMLTALLHARRDSWLVVGVTLGERRRYAKSFGAQILPTHQATHAELGTIDGDFIHLLVLLLALQPG